MTRITVNPHQLQDFAAKIQAQSLQGTTPILRLSNVIHGLDWEVIGSSSVLADWERASSLQNRIYEQMNGQVSFLQRKAQAFIQADEAGVRDISQPFERFPPPPPPIGFPRISSFQDVFDIFKAAMSTVVLFAVGAGVQALKALMVVLSGVDFFVLKYPRAEALFTQLEAIQSKTYLTDADREEAARIRAELRPLLNEMKDSTVKDALDVLEDKIPKGTPTAEALDKLYETFGVADDWSKVLDKDTPGQQ